MDKEDEEEANHTKVPASLCRSHFNSPFQRAKNNTSNEIYELSDTIDNFSTDSSIGFETNQRTSQFQPKFHSLKKNLTNLMKSQLNYQPTKSNQSISNDMYLNEEIDDQISEGEPMSSQREFIPDIETPKQTDNMNNSSENEAIDQNISEKSTKSLVNRQNQFENEAKRTNKPTPIAKPNDLIDAESIEIDFSDNSDEEIIEKTENSDEIDNEGFNSSLPRKDRSFLSSDISDIENGEVDDEFGSQIEHEEIEVPASQGFFKEQKVVFELIEDETDELDAWLFDYMRVLYVKTLDSQIDGIDEDEYRLLVKTSDTSHIRKPGDNFVMGTPFHIYSNQDKIYIIAPVVSDKL